MVYPEVRRGPTLAQRPAAASGGAGIPRGERGEVRTGGLLEQAQPEPIDLRTLQQYDSEVDGEQPAMEGASDEDE